MELIIKGEPKEIAALVVALQERQSKDVEEITQQVAGHLADQLSCVRTP